jgi:hypothetical protein
MMIEKTIISVWEYAKNNPDGFTINIETLETVKRGVAVAYLETQNSFGFEDLKKVVEHSLKHEKVVGGWLNTENNQYYFDSVRIFKNSELNEAIEFAKQNKQIAIFDITNLREIKTGGH